MNALARATALNAADRKGFAEARPRWLALGLGTSAIKPCNTFTASADKVR